MMSIISLLTIYIIPNPFNLLINYMAMIIISIHLFNLSKLQGIFTLSSSIIFALVGSLILNPYLTILNISYEQSATVPIYRLGYLLLMYLIIIIITYGIKIKNLKLNILDDIDTKNKIIIFANVVLGIITLFLQAIITIYYIDTLPIIITFLSFLSLLA